MTLCRVYKTFLILLSVYKSEEEWSISPSNAGSRKAVLSRKANREVGGSPRFLGTKLGMAPAAQVAKENLSASVQKYVVAF